MRGFIIALCLLAPLLALFSAPALALEPIVIGDEQDKIEITLLGEAYEGRGDRLQVETAPDADNISSRMAVAATTPGTNPNWVVFALNNPTTKRVTRWLTADRYNIIGSNVFWPHLDSGHMMQVTPSLGFRPERIANDEADIFRIELEPGATVTFIVELSTKRFPRLYLWKARAYEKRQRDLILFKGIMLGIAGLLAVFLTSIFFANHKAIFPAAALIAWSVVAYLCVDFGFWHKIFNLSPTENAIYRAASEAAIIASLVVFLYTFLRLSLWHGWIKLAFAGWVCVQVAIIGLAILDARLASGFARASFIPLAAIGTLLIAYLAVRGQDRALSLVPSWLLLLVWGFGVAVTIMGQLSGDIVVSGLVAGLVLLIVLMGFTVTQFAFRAYEPHSGAPPSQLQLRSLALDGANAAVWEWNARRDEISVSEDVEISLGLSQGTLNGRLDAWLTHLHPSDRERFRLLLWSIQEKNGGELSVDFRMRRSDSSYLWFELRAHSVPLTQYRSLRCVGVIREVTNEKRSQERLLHDAVHDSLTGLPNRELFLDRLYSAVTRTQEEGANRPTVLFIDIDRFKNVNNSFGLVVGDSMLLTIARRLSRHLSPLDTLARIGGDQFAILLVTEIEPRQIAMLAERVRRSLRSPMKIAGKEIILTGSIGISVYDGQQPSHQDVLREAEIAMYRAKRSGTDRVEIFKPSMRSESDDRVTLESDLRRALDRKQISIVYQPIISLMDESVVGFEALMRWDHPKLGRLSPDDFIPIAEDIGLISDLGNFVLEQSIKNVAKWQKILPRDDAPLFVNVNVSSRQLFRHDLVQDVRMMLGRETVPRGSVWLEVTESLVMENPEQAAEILELLRSAGAGLALDDFGTGYSSLSYLHRFPFDIIKVDKSIVQHNGINNSGPVILRTIISLAHELGKAVIAEGIEDISETTYLRNLGCEYVQGYHFGEPMPIKEVVAMLTTIAKTQKSSNKRKASSSRAKAGQEDVNKKGKKAKRAEKNLAGNKNGDAGSAEQGQAYGSAPQNNIDPPVNPNNPPNGGPPQPTTR